MKSLFNVNDAKTEFKADYGQLLNYFKDTPKENALSEFNINKERAEEELYKDDPSFKGGKFKDIFTDVIIDTKKELDAKPSQNFVNKRKRFLSEHDGDYVHERRYDINFMESARREKVLGNNLIKINACGGFSCRVSSKEIDAYAKEICELVNYFEAQGRSVELNLNYQVNSLFAGASLTNYFITVKKADQYLSKADIYRAFSTTFFRYIGFTCFIYTAEINKKTVSYSLGVPVVQNNKITVNPDEITIHGLTKDLVEKIKNDSI